MSWSVCFSSSPQVSSGAADKPQGGGGGVWGGGCVSESGQTRSHSSLTGHQGAGLGCIQLNNLITSLPVIVKV